MKSLFVTSSISCALTFLHAHPAFAADATGPEAAPLASASAPSSDVEASAPEVQLGEVIVTASRREVSIRKTPTAVSAYSGAKLEQAQVASLTDLTAISPNIQIGTFANAANVTIRGIGNTQLSASGSDPGVAVNADGVYLGQSGLVISSFLDVNRVEILRGPQGTLFGRNATGGAINVLPNTPTSDLRYGGDLTFGGDPTLIRSAGFVSGPLTADGRLQGRLAAHQNYNKGYSKNLLPGGPHGLDGTKTYGARAQLQWRPNSTIKSRLLVEYHKQDDAGQAQYFTGTPDPSIPLPGPLQGQPTGSVDDRTTYATQGVRELSSFTTNLVTDVALGASNLRALLSYNRNRVYTDIADGTPANFYDPQFGHNAQQYFAEALFTSPANRPLTYVLGANYYTEHSFQYIRVPISTFPMAVAQGGVLRTRSHAVFGQATYEVFDGFKVFAGARYTKDRKSTDEYGVYHPLLTLSQARSWSRLTYEVGSSYDLSSTVTGFVKYAKGYKGGGFAVGSLAPAFAPETNTNLEAGLKGAWLDGRLQANLSAFHMKYKDLQVNQIVGLGSQVTNAARATIDGVEIETVLRPAEHLRLDLSGAWLDARFDEFMTQDSSRPSLGLLSLAGNQLPMAPKFNASAGAYLDVPVSTGVVTLGARYDWKSRIYFSEFNIPVSSQGAIGKLNLSLRYEDSERPWYVNLFATNVTDVSIKSNVIVYSAVLGSPAMAVLEPGRQIGVTIGYKY
ncbi:MAG: TonB-dependent receptor [Phenylobacterium sp.]|uniref:TonB-dependent receptor n=1 Tax=Phenylobacterium sp. TaxID=1871053 RepID=UPI0025DFF13C|nr:TonB-dependent receptor [Phenylobacterium sp.]MBI1198992.1 TonB-dependent receptor [Phenylobacterium sp.]